MLGRAAMHANSLRGIGAASQGQFGPNWPGFGPNRAGFGPNGEKFGPNGEKFGPK